MNQPVNTMTKPALVEVTLTAPEEELPNEPFLLELAPFLSCLVMADIEGQPSGLQFALAKGYSMIYILSPEGTFLHRKLQPGVNGTHRYLQAKVTSIPRVKMPVMKEQANFFPNGLVPTALMYEVQAFFKAVIAKFGGTKLEAMIWIMWSQDRAHEPNRGYFTHVPVQTVGPASAKYEWTDLPPNSSIIVDIHSHADFNAFFSGTDNGDDRGAIRFSGVMGFNCRPVPEMKWRFINGDVMTDVTLDTIFGEAKPELPEISPEALAKVSVLSYGATAVHASSYGGGRGGWSGSYGAAIGSEGRPPFGQGPQGHTPPGKGGTSDSKNVVGLLGGLNSQAGAQSGTNVGSTSSSTSGTGHPEGSQQKSKPNSTHSPTLQQNLGFDEDEIEAWRQAYGFDNEYVSSNGGVLMPVKVDHAGKATVPVIPMVPTIRTQPDAARPLVRAADLGTPPRSVNGTCVTYRVDHTGAITARLSSQDLSGSFDATVVNEGSLAACANALIEAASMDLMKSTGLLRSSTEEMFAMIPDDEKLAVFRTLAHSLSPKARQSLCENGL